MAPEILKIRPYTKQVDWLALGVTMFEMHTKTYPFHETDNSESQLINEVCNHQPEIEVADRTQDASDLLEKLLDKRKRNMPRATALISGAEPETSI